jgi:hypothetical protein
VRVPSWPESLSTMILSSGIAVDTAIDAFDQRRDGAVHALREMRDCHAVGAGAAIVFLDALPGLPEVVGEKSISFQYEPASLCEAQTTLTALVKTEQYVKASG